MTDSYASKEATARSAMKLALEALKQIDEAMPFPVAKLAQAALREALAEQPAEQHSDDVAVDRFAEAMKAKMAKQRVKGYGGWDDPAACPTERLQQMLVAHISKGDPLDVANFAMMLWNRGERTEQPAQQEPVAWMNPHGGMLTANYIENFASGLDKEIHNIPLYTSPPASKPWVGLPESAFAAMTLQQVSAMKYAELVLKEKNNG